MGLHPNGEGTERRRMDAKKLMVGLVTAVTLMLFTAAAYAQQLEAPQEDTAQTSVVHHKECD